MNTHKTRWHRKMTGGIPVLRAANLHHGPGPYRDMRILVATLHGIMAEQTDPSWPDKFDAWMFERDPEVKTMKKEYRAGPFPRWNCWFKDPFLARSLANELELFLQPSEAS